MLAHNGLRGNRLHSILRLLEARDHRLFSDATELHIVELGKLEGMSQEERDRETRLIRWASFLNASTRRQLQAAAQGDPVMGKAKKVLGAWSREEQARYWEERREIAQKLYPFELAEERRLGEQIGEERAEKRLEEIVLAFLVRLYERRLDRELCATERATLQQRLTTLGPNRPGDVVFDLPPEELAKWLSDPDAK